MLKLAHEEVKVRVLLAGVGQITESDVQLAKASSAVIIGFNVRATSQARELAQRESVDIRYFSIIYEVSDDIEKLVKGKVAPKAREKFLGYAEVRKVFNITKTGKVAGCMITEGVVKRGAGVRVLRDNVVIHTGELSQLKRFKDDVKEVARGYECGLSFANFEDLQEGDVVECFESGDGPGLTKRSAPAGANPAAVARGGGNPPRAVRGVYTRPSSAIRSWPLLISLSPKCASAPDLKHATAFISRLGRSDVDALLPSLRAATPYLRGQVAKALRLRVAPDLVVPAGSWRWITR